MRRRVVFALGVAISIAAGFVACGLDESGQADGGGVDATSNEAGDAPIDVVIDVPQACKTLDASACVDADVPDGWTYAVISPFGACPTSTDYDPTAFLTTPTAVGACACTCNSVTGSVDCSGAQIEAGTQTNNCNGNKSFVFDAGNTPVCEAPQWNDQHILIANLPVGVSNVSCDASAPSPAWDAATTTACTPKCSADFCNVSASYKRCIIAANQPSCPAPFTDMQAPLGVEAGVVSKCTGCTCSIDAGQCGANVTAFSSPACDGGIIVDAATTDGSCNAYGTNINSFLYSPIVPLPSCTATGGTGSAAFVSSITVCCLP